MTSRTSPVVVKVLGHRKHVLKSVAAALSRGVKKAPVVRERELFEAQFGVRVV